MRASYNKIVVTPAVLVEDSGGANLALPLDTVPTLLGVLWTLKADPGHCLRSSETQGHWEIPVKTVYGHSVLWVAYSALDGLIASLSAL